MTLEKIKSLREENGYTQAQLADYLRIKKSTYSNYENGTIRVPTKIIVKLADYYNTSVDYLVGRPNVKTPHTQKNL